MGFIIILPLSFIAGVFVPIAGMDAIPRAIADWDPLSALVATVRSLTTPGYHSAVAMLIWCLLLMAICVPLALRRFNRTLSA
jgi:ABC-2 type transport system permease protein